MNTVTKRLVGVITASFALAMICPAAAAADVTLIVFEHDTQQHFVDNNEPGPGPGDQFLFTGDLFDRPGGVFLGTNAGVCTTISGDETGGQTSCHGAFNLAGGQVMVNGVVDSAALFVRSEPCPFAITGGTGIYRTARGDGTIQIVPNVPNQTDANFVLNVTG